MKSHRLDSQNLINEQCTDNIKSDNNMNEQNQQDQSSSSQTKRTYEDYMNKNCQTYKWKGIIFEDETEQNYSIQQQSSLKFQSFLNFIDILIGIILYFYSQTAYGVQIFNIITCSTLMPAQLCFLSKRSNSQTIIPELCIVYSILDMILMIVYGIIHGILLIQDSMEYEDVDNNYPGWLYFSGILHIIIAITSVVCICIFRVVITKYSDYLDEIWAKEDKLKNGQAHTGHVQIDHVDVDEPIDDYWETKRKERSRKEEQLRRRYDNRNPNNNSIYNDQDNRNNQRRGNQDRQHDEDYRNNDQRDDHRRYENNNRDDRYYKDDYEYMNDNRNRDENRNRRQNNNNNYRNDYQDDYNKQD